MILRLIRSRAFAWIMTWTAVAALFVFTIAGLHHYSDVNRAQATASTRAVLVESCNHNGNDLRKVIKGLLATGKPQLHHQLAIGKIDKTEYNFQLKQLAKDQAKVKLVNCEKLYAPIH